MTLIPKGGDLGLAALEGQWLSKLYELTRNVQ